MERETLTAKQLEELLEKLTPFCAELQEQAQAMEKDYAEATMQRATFDKEPSYDTYIATDAEARRIATELMNK